MKKRTKNIIRIISLLIILAIPINTSALQQTSKNELKELKLQNEMDFLKTSGNIIIKDKKILDEIVKTNNIKVPKGYNLTEIAVLQEDIDIRKNTGIQEDIMRNFASGTLIYTIKNVTTRTGTYYYPDSLEVDEVNNYSYSVTDTYERTIVKTYSSGWSANVTVSSGDVCNAVGFNVSTSYTDTRFYSTSIPPRKKMRFEVSNGALWKDFDVYDAIGLFQTGSGNAHRPNGILVYKFESPL